jgi:hypothetical protein
LMEKTNKQTSDVILYDNRVIVFKLESDVMLYVVGSADENEVLLYNVVLSLRDALGILFKCVISMYSTHSGLILFHGITLFRCLVLSDNANTNTESN